MLATGIALFVAAHLLPGIPGLRPALVSRLGEMPFKGVVSVGALLGLALIVLGWGDASVDAIYAPPTSGRHVAWLAVPAALVLLISAYVPSRIRRFVGHPMACAVVVWGLAHLLANHEWRSVVLFGSLAAWGAASWLLAALRDGARPHPVPEAPRDGLVVLGGLGLTGALLLAHPMLFGVAVVP